MYVSLLDWARLGQLPESSLNAVLEFIQFTSDSLVTVNVINREGLRDEDENTLAGFFGSSFH